MRQVEQLDADYQREKRRSSRGQPSPPQDERKHEADGAEDEQEDDQTSSSLPSILHSPQEETKEQQAERAIPVPAVQTSAELDEILRDDAVEEEKVQPQGGESGSSRGEAAAAAQEADWLQNGMVTSAGRVWLDCCFTMSRSQEQRDADAEAAQAEGEEEAEEEQEEQKEQTGRRMSAQHEDGARAAGNASGQLSQQHSLCLRLAAASALLCSRRAADTSCSSLSALLLSADVSGSCSPVVIRHVSSLCRLLQPQAAEERGGGQGCHERRRRQEGAAGGRGKGARADAPLLPQPHA